jgi:hypothetical protein
LAGDENVQLVHDAVVRCSADVAALDKVTEDLAVIGFRTSWNDRLLYPELFNVTDPLFFDFPVAQFKVAVAEGNVGPFFTMVFDRLARLVDQSRGN